METMSIPAKFWGTISEERFGEIVVSGHLNVEESQTVYRMNDLTPPDRIEPMPVLIKTEELEKVLAQK